MRPSQPLLERYRLARWVVVGSFITLFLLVAALIALAQGNKDVADTAKNAFAAILPVLAGWVGTVLAFYFSASSSERISDSLDRVIKQGGGGPAVSKPAAEKMIPVSMIAELQQLDADYAKKTTIEALQGLFDKTLPSGGKITRLLFVENGVFKYILHVGTLHAFIVKKKDSSDPLDKTFAGLLADEETHHQIANLVVFVSAGATLGDAKAALDKVKGAQDIIVTGSGNATEPMLGWLSNVDLTKVLQVN